jgi:hypothetical protein
MSAEAGPQAHSPTQAELEKEYNETKRPSFLLLSKPEYITTKREDFRSCCFSSKRKSGC